MPHMPTLLPAKEADREVVTYLHRRGNNVRIQLEAVDAERDARGRTMKKGYTSHIQFTKGLFTTNIAKLQDGLEESFAYQKGEVEREDVLAARANEKQLEGMMALAEKDPKLAAELRSRLTKMQLAAKKATKDAKDEGIPTGEATTSTEE